MNDEDERKETEALAAITRLGVSPLVWLAVCTMSFVGGSAVDAMQAWDYTVQDCLMAAAGSAMIGIAVSIPLEARYWIGFTHFAALAYVLALLCSVPALREPLASVQVLLFLSAIVFSSAAYSLHRRYASQTS